MGHGDITGDTVALEMKPPHISMHLPAGGRPDLSPPSPVPGVLPGPPSTPVVTNVTKSSVTLSWRGNEDSVATGVTSYIVEAFRYRTSIPFGCMEMWWPRATPARFPLSVVARRRVAHGGRWQLRWLVRPTP